MNRFARYALGAGLVLAGAAPAFASPVGTWEIEMRDSRYEATMCGDGTQLCVKLIWLGNGAEQQPENIPYLNQLIINEAKQTRPGEWKGQLNLYGHKAAGTITQVNENQITLQGCVLAVFCKSYEMYRYNG